MEKVLSLLEFNYMIMQAYDFYALYQNYGCNLQFGGDDQWSNMLAGTELIRRKLGKDASAMTITLLLNSEGKKMGKTNGKATFYIGFDPTADSLHVGHFMALCLMKRLQMAGNKPIALIGGGTGMIGDPSGRTDMRQMMTPETIQHNCDCFKKQMSKFIDFSEGKALMVNNADWLMDLNYIEVLREVGAHFSVNRMLSAEC